MRFNLRSYASSSISNRSFLLFLVLLSLKIPILSAQEIDIFLDDYPRLKEIPCQRYTVPGTTNSHWDWRAEKFELVYFPGNGPAITRVVSSPFHQATFTFHPNTNFLTHGVPDYDPADGWELLYRNFGSIAEPVGEPSFGLYNRYSSLIRIFYWLEPNGETVYQNMTLNLKHVLQGGPNSSKVSAILEHLNIPANPLENFDKSGLSVGQLNEIIINGTWMILEFPASYDPCVCLHETSLEIRPILSSISEIQFEIEGTGTSETIYGPGSTSGSYLGTGLDYVNGFLGSLQSGYKIYKELGDTDSGTFLDYLDDGDSEALDAIAAFLPDFFRSLEQPLKSWASL